MTYDFGALTPAQQRAADLVAINRDFESNPRTLGRLVELGVVESYDESAGGRPPVIVKRYVMPVRVHMAWCEWCSRNVEAEQHGG